MAIQKDARILIVDDDPEILELVREILRTRFHTAAISACNNGEMAAWEIDRAVRAGRPFDLVVSDWNMPNMSGIELLKQVRARPATAALPFILLTSNAEKDKVVEAAVFGVTAYVVKPLSEETLVQKVSDLFSAKPLAG